MRDSERDGTDPSRDGSSKNEPGVAVRRRRFLQASAATVSLASLGTAAGEQFTAGSSAAQSVNVPDYANWIPADDRFVSDMGRINVNHVDIEQFLDFLQFDAEQEEDDQQQNESSPFQIEPTLIGVFGVSFGIANLEELGLAEPIMGQSVNVDDTSTIPDEAPADGVTFAGNMTVYTGSFDAGALGDAVEASSLQESSTSGIYTGQTSLGPIALAWDSGYLVTGQTVGEVSAALEAHAGQQPRRHEQNGDFARLLAGVAGGDFVGVTLSQNQRMEFSQSDSSFISIDYSPLSDAGVQGYANSNSFDLDGPQLDVTTVLSWANEGSVATGSVSTIGAEAQDRSQSRNGRFVTIQMAYTQADVLGNEDSGNTGDGSDDGGSDDGSDGSDDGSSGSDGSDDGSSGSDDGSDGSDDGSSGSDDGSSGSDGSDDGDTSDSSDGSTDDSAGGTDDGGDGGSGSDGESNGDGEGSGDGDSGDDSGPGFGAFTALTGLGGAGYLLKRRVNSLQMPDDS